jgi:hypothetical protein
MFNAISRTHVSLLAPPKGDVPFKITLDQNS